jgi:Spy/CpxP family protein refolding chaperone
MRTFCKWALALAAGVVWAAPARPGEKDDLPGQTTFQLLLLRQKSVQQELKITPGLAKKIHAFTNEEHQEFLKALKLGKEEGLKRILELRQANQKFLEDNLSAAQRKRLGQIYLQVTGLHQLTRPEVVKALKLTEAQQAKFKEMHTAAHKKFIEIVEGKDRKERNAKLAELRVEVNKAIVAVLTDKQKAKAKEVVGEPFTGELLFEEDDGPSSSATPTWRSAPAVGAARFPLQERRMTCGLNAVA